MQREKKRDASSDMKKVDFKDEILNEHDFEIGTAKENLVDNLDLEQTSIKETIDETFPNKLREILDLKEERVVTE